MAGACLTGQDLLLVRHGVRPDDPIWSLVSALVVDLAAVLSGEATLVATGVLVGVLGGFTGTDGDGLRVGIDVSAG